MVRTVFMEHLFSCKKNNKIKNLIEKEIFITLIRWISICSNTHTYAELSKMCRETNNTKIFVNSKHARMTCDNIEFGSFTCAVIRCVHLPIADSMKPSHFWQLVNCYTHTHTHALAHSLNSLFVGLLLIYYVFRWMQGKTTLFRSIANSPSHIDNNNYSPKTIRNFISSWYFTIYGYECKCQPIYRYRHWEVVSVLDVLRCSHYSYW